MAKIKFKSLVNFYVDGMRRVIEDTPQVIQLRQLATLDVALRVDSSDLQLDIAFERASVKIVLPESP